jgi:hypothetical protein
MNLKSVSFLNKPFATVEALSFPAARLSKCTLTHFQSLIRAERALTLLATHLTLCKY